MQGQRGETGLEPEPPGAKRTRDGRIGRGNAAHAERGGRATPMRVTLDATRPLASPPTRGANEGSPYIAPLGSQRRMDANAQLRPGRCNHLLATHVHTAGNRPGRMPRVGRPVASQPSTPLRPLRLGAPLSAGVSSVHVVRFGIEFLSVSRPPIFFGETEVHP